MSVIHKTYSHLAARQRKPTRYEIATSRLHYYVDRGFEVNLPAGDWYRRYQQGSPLRAPDWESFADPRQTDYSAYVRLQHAQEAHLDGVLMSIDESHYDRDLSPAARQLLERTLAPLRFALHGFQMVAAYIGQMAPASRITIAALLQGADESRRIQRIAYRIAQLRQHYPNFAQDSRARWQDDPVWQPLRELVERMLVAYDWGEALVALNLCAKPLLDDLFMVQLPVAAKGRQDYLLGQFTSSMARDCEWHRQWTAALMALALRGDAGCLPAVDDWIARWAPRVGLAAAPFAMVLGPDGARAVAASLHQARDFHDQMGLATATRAAS